MMRAGFTLIELMIALAVLLMLVTVMLAAGTAVTRSYGQLMRQQESLNELMMLDRTLDSLLTNAVPFTWTDKDKKPVLLFRGESDRLVLSYKHRLNNVSDGALRFAGLVVEDGELRVYYQERPVLDLAKLGPAARMTVLARGVRQVQFRYADGKASAREIEWLDEWDPDRPELPLGIMVLVDWEDGLQESWVRRTAGSGWYERFGNWRPSVK